MRPISWYKSLAISKYRRQYGYFLIEGMRAVDQTLTYHRDYVEELICVDDCNISSLSQNNVPIRKVSDANMKMICTARTPQGIVALIRIPKDVYTSDIPEITGNRLLLLEHIQDPGNVGTLIRTAAAFGINGVILSDKCADPFAPKVIQSTAGSLLSVWIRKTDDYMSLIANLKIVNEYKLIAADLNGSESINVNGDIDKYILALGNEGSGLTDKLLAQCDLRLRVPITPAGAESLNVAVSGGILMYLLSRNKPAGQKLRRESG